jgi:hypothetical protein
MKIDHIYIITINHTDENYIETLNRINEIGIPNECTYEFLGVNGSEVTSNDLQSDGIKLYSKWNLDNTDMTFDDAGDNKYWHRELTNGEIGCALSHIKIWEDAYEKKYDNIIIFEDDVENDGKPYNWDVLSSIRELNYDLFYLGRHLQQGYDEVGDTPLENYPGLCVPGFSYQSHAYMMSRSGIVKMVEDYLPILKNNLLPIDEFLPALCNWTPRLDLNDIFPKNYRVFSRLEWDMEGVLQYRAEEFGNSMTMPNE